MSRLSMSNTFVVLNAGLILYKTDELADITRNTDWNIIGVSKACRYDGRFEIYIYRKLIYVLVVIKSCSGEIECYFLKFTVFLEILKCQKMSD